MLMKVLLSCSHPSPDMPLRLIHVQHLPCLPGKRRVNLEEPLGNILMYRTLTDPKLLRCQKNPPANIVFTMYAGGKSLIHVLENMIIHNQCRKYNGNH